jgi:thiamine-monophosphate kinase
MASEDQLIGQVRRKFSTRANGLGVGIGDDAAVIRPARRGEWVLTTDAFLENVHFLKRIHPPRAIGFKALARATSDLAAMGAKSRYFLLGLALPAACTGKWLVDFLDGMALAAQRFGLVLAGGDTTRYPSIAINITVLGEIESGRAIRRSGARPGDLICVSGKLGEAELGLQLVHRSLHKDKRWKHLLKKQLYPEPRLALGQWLATHNQATAMIDTSDGLSTDLAHICKASSVGARIWAEKIPTAAVPKQLRKLGLDPLDLAVDGGEDYELLFTVPKRLAGRLPRTIRGVPVTIIGEITREKRIVLVDDGGQDKPLPARGWDPFRKPRTQRRPTGKLK